MRYRVSLKKNWLCYLACGLMLLSAALRLGHFIPRWAVPIGLPWSPSCSCPAGQWGVLLRRPEKRRLFDHRAVRVPGGAVLHHQGPRALPTLGIPSCVPSCICWCSSFTPSLPWGCVQPLAPKAGVCPALGLPYQPRTCFSRNPPSWQRPSRNSPCCASWAPCWPLPSPFNRTL